LHNRKHLLELKLKRSLLLRPRLLPNQRPFKKRKLRRKPKPRLPRKLQRRRRKNKLLPKRNSLRKINKKPSPLFKNKRYRRRKPPLKPRSPSNMRSSTTKSNNSQLL